MTKNILELLINSLSLSNEYSKSRNVDNVQECIDSLTEEEKAIILDAYHKYWSENKEDTFEDIIQQHFKTYDFFRKG